MTGFCGGGCLGWIPLSYIDPGRLILASWSKWSALGSTNTLTLTVFKPFLELMLTNEMCSTHDIMIKNIKNVIASDVFLMNFLLWMFRQGECFICVFLRLISEHIKTPLPPPPYPSEGLYWSTPIMCQRILNGLFAHNWCSTVLIIVDWLALVWNLVNFVLKLIAQSQEQTSKIAIFYFVKPRAYIYSFPLPPSVRCVRSWNLRQLDVFPNEPSCLWDTGSYVTTHSFI